MRGVLVFLLLSASSVAVAQPAAARTQHPIDPTEQVEREPGDDPDIEERDVPNYDGREDRPVSVGDVLIWIPRIVMFPVYLVTEFLLRRPLGFLVTNAEEAEVPDKVVQFFTFGPSNNIALAPTFSFDFGFRPTVGAFFRYNDLGSEGHNLRAGFSIARRDLLSGSVAYRWAPKNGNWEMQLSGSATKRPDGLFFGLGSQASESLRSRYDWVSYDANLRVTGSLWRQSSISMSLGYRNQTYGDDAIGNTTVNSLVENGLLDELPPGFEDGVSAIIQRTRLTIDTRPSRPAPGTGARVVGEYTFGFDANDPESQMWLNYGGTAAAFFDISGFQHVIGVHVSAAVAEALQGDVPFLELPFLSTNGPMRGFVGRFLSGESEFSVLVDYHWPVWNWLDGTLHVAMGNVYDGKFEDFSLENMRLSFGIGLAGVAQRDHFFEFLVGFGTDTFENRPDVESIRILFGGTREF
ncbi:MAG: hypothetical protein AAGE52_30855 [Myxococcota bacterium]